jgi:serine/threonine protein kinase
MANRVGQQLGNYRLVRLLGRGSFAEVYLGEHVHLKMEAAVKVLRTQLATDDAEDFLNDAILSYGKKNILPGDLRQGLTNP